MIGTTLWYKVIHPLRMTVLLQNPFSYWLSYTEICLSETYPHWLLCCLLGHPRRQLFSTEALQMSEENCCGAGWCHNQSIQFASGLSPRSSTVGCAWSWGSPVSLQYLTGDYPHRIRWCAGASYGLHLLSPWHAVISCWSLQMSHSRSSHTMESGKCYKFRLFVC